MHNKETIFRSQ